MPEQPLRMPAPVLGNDVVWLAPGAWLVHDRDFLSPEQADDLMKRLKGDLDWRQQPIRLFGREVMQPRLIDFHGDRDIRYRYSGLILQAAGWPEPLEAIRDRLTEDSGTRFNSVLCNLYRGGNDSMGWHADDERELGRNPTVASISLGGTRRFVLRPRSGGRSVEFRPEHGSLLLMGGDLQHHWQHQVPKTSRPVGERINLTFRTVLEPPTN